jgi:hypothetical protein
VDGRTDGGICGWKTDGSLDVRINGDIGGWADGWICG